MMNIVKSIRKRKRMILENVSKEKKHNRKWLVIENVSMLKIY
jgi:hypothetical protein